VKDYYSGEVNFLKGGRKGSERKHTDFNLTYKRIGKVTGVESFKKVGNKWEPATKRGLGLCSVCRGFLKFGNEE